MLHAVTSEGLVEDLGIGPSEIVGAAAYPVELVSGLLDALELGVELLTVADAAAASISLTSGEAELLKDGYRPFSFLCSEPHVF